MNDRQMAIFRGKATRFVMSAFLTLCATTSPAQAAVEAVAPVSGGCYSVPYIGCYSTALAGCQAWFVAMGPFYTSFVSVPANDMNGAYCEARSIQTGSSYSSHAKYLDATCPVPAINPRVLYTYNTVSGMCERPAQETCPIPPLPPVPENDKCAQSLENGAGVDVNEACPDLTPEMQKQAQCLAIKINRLALPVTYTKPSATIRNTAYQQHLVDILKWSKDIEKLTDAQKQSCAAVIADVDVHVKRHGKITTPSRRGGQAPHVLGRAIDIPEAVVEAMIAKVNNTTFISPVYCLFCIPPIPVYISDAEDYVNSALVNPPACNLRWGGLFDAYDPVHFQLP